VRSIGRTFAWTVLVVVAIAFGLMRVITPAPSDDEIATVYGRRLGIEDRAAAVRVYRAAVAALGPTLSDGRVRRAANPSRPAAEVAGELALHGLARLSLADLDQWNRLTGALADATPEACTEMSSRNPDPRRIGPALAHLSDADLRAWFELQARAARLELDGEAAPTIDPTALDCGYDAMIASASPDDAEFLQTALAAAMLDDASACRLVRLTTQAARALPPNTRDPFFRALVSRD
jgi:hypothetical protein